MEEEESEQFEQGSSMSERPNRKRNASEHYGNPKMKCDVNVNKKTEQAGTGPSRRHIQGSKIAKRLPSVKYSFTVLENRKFFENFFLKLHTKKMDRVARRGWRAKVSQCRKTERGTL